jgi:zinc protease
MKNLQVSTLILSSVIFLSCSTSPKSPAQSQVQLRPIQEVTLENGLKVLYIQDKTLPRVSYHLMVRSGSSQDPAGAEGLAALTVSLLEQGSKKRGALQIADDFAQLGSSFNESAAWDYVMVSTAGLSGSKSRLLELFSDVSLNPQFAAAEVNRKKSQSVASLTQLPDQPTEFASQLFDKEVFGQHPYAHPVSGYVRTVKNLKREQVARFYEGNFRPNNAILAVAGDFDHAFRAEVEKTFSQWKGSSVEKREIPVPAMAEKMAFKLVSKEGLQQTQVRLGQVAIGRSHPDFLRLRLANVVLGGAFASRLTQKVRDDLGLTYSISSAFESRINTGSFEINTFVRNEKVGEAIKRTLEVVRDFRKSGVTEKELAAAKALLVGQFPAAIETVDRLALNLMILRVYGVPDTYLTDFLQNVNSITLSEVNAAIQRHLKPETFKVLVFADEKSVRKELSEVGSFQVEPATNF